MPTGVLFNIQNTTGLHFNLYANLNNHIKPPTYFPNQPVFVPHQNLHAKAKITTIPTVNDDVYTVQYRHNNSLHQYQGQYISTVHLNLSTIKHNSLLKIFPTWIKDYCPEPLSLKTK